MHPGHIFAGNGVLTGVHVYIWHIVDVKILKIYIEIRLKWRIRIFSDPMTVRGGHLLFKSLLNVVGLPIKVCRHLRNMTAVPPCHMKLVPILKHGPRLC